MPATPTSRRCVGCSPRTPRSLHARSTRWRPAATPRSNDARRCWRSDPGRMRFLYLLVPAGGVGVTLPPEPVLGARVWSRPRRLALTLLPGGVVFLTWDFVAIAPGQWGYRRLT